VEVISSVFSLSRPMPISLSPGQDMTVSADIRTADGQSGDGVFSFTPGMVQAPNGVKILSGCR